MSLFFSDMFISLSIASVYNWVVMVFLPLLKIFFTIIFFSFSAMSYSLLVGNILYEMEQICYSKREEIFIIDSLTENGKCDTINRI